jgi:hypothetical protein
MTGLINNAESVINQRKQGRTPTKYTFPSDLGAHAMLINFNDFVYDPMAGVTVNQISNSILLPIPSNLTDSYDVNVGQQDLGITGQGIYDLLNYMKAGKTFADMGKSAADLVMKNLTSDNNNDFRSSQLSDLKTAAMFFGRTGLDQIAPGAGQAVDLYTGNAVNPHTTINFDGVKLKTHSFSWTFAPKTPSETETLNKIINFIRSSILPQYKAILGASATSPAALSRALLTYPKLANISFLGVDQDYYYKFKPSMVSNFSVNFTDGTNVNILTGGKPAIVNMRMNFIETQIHTAEDYPSSTYS